MHKYNSTQASCPSPLPPTPTHRLVCLLFPFRGACHHAPASVACTQGVECGAALAAPVALDARPVLLLAQRTRQQLPSLTHLHACGHNTA